MEKLFKLLFILDLFCIILFCNYITPIILEKQALYQNKQAITLIETSSDTTPDEMIQGIHDLSLENEIYLTRIIRNTSSMMNIFNNNPETEKKIKFFKNNDTSEIEWFNNHKVYYHDLINAGEFGVSGTYFIDKDYDRNHFSVFQSKVKEDYGIDVGIDSWNQSSNLIVIQSIIAQPYFLMGIFIFIIITLFSYWYICSQNSKKYALMVLSGYSKSNIVTAFMKSSMLIPVVISLLLAGITTILYGFFFLKSFLSLYITVMTLAVVYILILIGFFLITHIWLFSIQNKNFNSYMKGKNELKGFMIFSKVIQLVFLLSIPFLVHSMQTNYYEWKDALKEIKKWDKTENVYATTIQFITPDTDLNRVYENKAKQFYVNSSDKLALIDASKYDTLTNGTPLYKANTTDELDQKINPNGKSIYINQTYLKWNPILDVNGENIYDQINIKKGQLTLLVPINLKKYEQQIIQNYKKQYDWLVYEIPTTIYSEELDKSEVEINIIYTQNDQTYFTYNENIQGDTHYDIMDPIAVVDNQEFDSSQYYSWLTRAVYFKDNEQEQGLNVLNKELVENNMTDQIQQVIPIYDNHQDKIQQYKQMIAIYAGLSIITITAMLFYLYLFYAGLLEKNKRKLRIQQLSGYTVFNMYASYVAILALDLIVFLFMEMYVTHTIAYSLFTVVMILDMLVFLFAIYLHRRVTTVNDNV